MEKIRLEDCTQLNDYQYDNCLRLLLKHNVTTWIPDGCYGTDSTVFIFNSFDLDSIGRTLNENKIVCFAVPYEADTIILFSEYPYILDYEGQNNYDSAVLIESGGLKYIVVAE